MKKPKVWQIILGVFIVLIGISMFANDTSSTNDNEKVSTASSTQDDLTLEDGTTGSADEYGISYTITGYVKNNTDNDYSYVQISFNAYDKDGNTVGSCWANNSGLEANGRWKFSAICSGDADTIASYKLTDITKY